MNRQVTGTIRQGGRPLNGATVQAFNQSGLDRAAFLAEAITSRTGAYAITYDVETPRQVGPDGRAAPAPINLLIRVFATDGSALGASPIRFDARSAETIDLTVSGREIREISEYEDLLEKLAPARGGKTDLARLTDEDVQFLSSSSRVATTRITTLRQAASLAEIHELPTEIFFAVLRQGLTPDDEGTFDPDAAAAAVERAVGNRIVPARTRDASRLLRRRMRDRREARGAARRTAFASHQVVGKLLNADSEAPLLGFTVHAENLDADEETAQLGFDLSNRAGLFGISYTRPADASTEENLRLRLRVLDAAGEEIHQAEISTDVESEEIHEIRVQLDAQETDSPSLDQIGVSLSPALQQAVDQHSLRTLADVRAAGGLTDLEGMPDDDPAVKTLEAHASLDAVSSDLEANQALIARGLTDPAAVANARRTLVADATHEALGDTGTVEMQARARGRTAIAANYLTGLRVLAENGREAGNDAGRRALRRASSTARCGCKDCESAVSPLAYLADLMEYALTHLVDDGDSIDLAFLTRTFHQPFAELPATCEAMDARVPQVRLGIEVLRRYLAAERLPDSATMREELARHESAYRLAAYLELLGHLGVSYDELRLARTADEDQRKAVADRLGIEPQHLEELFLDAGRPRDRTATSKITEAHLEELFGLADTTRDALAQQPEARLAAWRREHLRVLWREQDEAGVGADEPLPIIDPDLVGPADFVGLRAGQPVLELWQARRDWVDETLAELDAQRQATTTILAGLDAVLFSTLELDLETWTTLVEATEQGESIGDQLAEHGLTLAELSALRRVRSLAEAESTVLVAEWDDFDSILTQVLKRRRFEEWRQEEHDAGVVLGPDQFRLPEPPALRFPPSEPPPLPAWRASVSARRDWMDRLESRIEQRRTAVEAVQEAVRSTEEATLPALRDALVAATSRQRTQVATAEELAERLLIDLRTDGCQQTTRIAQAIETVQGLLWAVRNRLLEDIFPDLDLDADDFDEAWQWIGSYATWRTAMFVFLYPENLLAPGLRRHQTPAFRDLGARLRANRRITPEQAAAAATEYVDYFHDVSTLRLDASCQARTRLRALDGTATSYSYLLYAFARGGASGTVYWSNYDPEDSSGFAQSYWQALPALEDTLQVFGATVFEIGEGERHLYLFCRVRERGTQKLVYLRYDLEERVWDEAPTELALPVDGYEHTAVLVQSEREGARPGLAVRMPDGSIFYRRMNPDGTDWEESEWRLLAGHSKGAGLRLRALIEFGAGELCLIAGTEDERLVYRFFGARDDGTWQRVDRGRFLGAFRLPGTQTIYVFFRRDGKERYRTIRPSERPWQTVEIADLPTVHDWLLEAAGANLHSVKSEIESYEGLTIYELLSLDIDTDPNRAFWDQFDKFFPDAIVDDLHREILKETKRQAVRWLYGKARDASPTDPDFGPWKRADDCVWWFSDRSFNLTGALFEPATGGSATLRSRDRQDELGPRLAWTAGLRWIAPISGNVPDVEQRTFAYQHNAGQKGLFRCRFQTIGELLAPAAVTRLAPAATGPFTIPQQLSEAKLQFRRTLIEQAFEANLDGPRSNLTYLEEAYYFVPVQLALQLQARGHYTAALDYFRTVYDYSMPAKERPIYYGLVEDSGPSRTRRNYRRPEDWLLDPLDPHAIAETRSGTYIRYTLVAVVSCLLDYADAEFTRDTAESVPRARQLYLTALELLGAPDLRQLGGACAEIAGNLQITVGDPYWLPVVHRLQRQLADVGDLETRTAVAARIQTTLAAGGSLAERFEEARSLITVATEPKPLRRIAEVVEGQAETRRSALMALEADPVVAREAGRAGQAAAHDFRRALSIVTGRSAKSLGRERVAMPELRRKLTAPAANEWPPAAGDRSDHRRLSRLNVLAPSRTARLATVARRQPIRALRTLRRLTWQYVPNPSFAFCIPTNPVVKSKRLHAELNLYKLRTCRNIAGVERQLEPYAAPTDTVSGLPQIGAGGQLVLPALGALKPTPYRYPALIERAKQLVGLAQQIEAAMLSALEKGDAERYGLLRARQDVRLAHSGVRLQSLRVKEARDGVRLAELQRDRAEIQADHFKELLDAGISELEQRSLNLMYDALDLSIKASAAAAVPNIIAGFSNGSLIDWSGIVANLATAVSQEASIMSTLASYERRAQDWELQKSLGEQDIKIGTQQIKIAEDRVRVTEQERVIAEMQTDHAQEALDFLANKFTNAELYDWMSGVLEGVYGYFLQQATSMAMLAEQQLAFERQQTPPPFIQADYWQDPAGGIDNGLEGDGPDRRGLTGSARLLQDVHQLDQYAFDTDHRKLQLNKALSLANLAPAEFQRFRETGVLTFSTPMELFDRDFPGHYLRLIKKVRVSVIALIPPAQGIRATLSTTGTSRVVIGGDLFQAVTVNQGPRSVALSSPLDATGLFELDTQPEMLLPFEGMGVDATWELRMPKAANLFDYRTLADVLVTFEYTALDSFVYRQQVLQELDDRISADRPFSFRHQFADPWYELHNPEQSAEPMTVRFKTRREDFPPNLEALKIQHLVLYFARAGGAGFELPITQLRFTEEGTDEAVGGGATTVDGAVSTRQGNAGSWLTMLGRKPIGDWELALPDSEEVRRRFEDEEIEDILLVLTYRARTPDWPT